MKVRLTIHSDRFGDTYTATTYVRDMEDAHAYVERNFRDPESVIGITPISDDSPVIDPFEWDDIWGFVNLT